MSTPAQNVPPSDPNVVNIEVNGVPMQARKGQMIIEVTDRHDVYVPRFCYHPKLTIAANCRMCLVEVEKAPKPLAGLRHSGGRGHEGLHALEARDLGAEGDDGVPADQPSARLPHLRSGRGVRAAGSCHGLRSQRIALHGAQAHRQGQESWAARQHRHDALHPLHAVCSIRPGDRRHSRARHELSQRPIRDRHVHREERRP